jgi:hypothetical protein
VSAPTPAKYDPVARAAALAWKAPDARHPWQWAEDNYTPPVTAMPGKWRSENSPWVKRLTECFADNAIEQITALCSAQSAKTETALLLLNWIVAEDPSPTMWVTSSDEEGLKFANERLMPSMRQCPPVAKQIPDDRTLAKSMEILFPTMMMEIVGANSKSKLQSRSRRYLLLDEVRNWPDWALPMVLKRARTWWNRRILILTTPGTAHDTVHQNFLEGSQEHYHVPCLSPAGCDYRGPLEFENLKAAHPTERDGHGRPVCVKWSEVPGALTPDGKWDLDTLSPHLRYQCPKCGHLHADHPAVRRQLAHGGDWIAHNPKAPAHRVSFTWNAMLSPWVKWRNVVEEFLLAQNALEFGNHEPFKAFWTETLGRPWEDRLRFVKTEGYIDERVLSADEAAKPLPNATRMMMIDVQGKGGRHFYWGVFDFAQGGAHRAVGWGKAWSVEELRAVQADYKVPSAFVGIDSGHFTNEVYRHIIDSGVLPNGEYAWKAMKGDRAPFYRVSLGDGQVIRLPYQWSFVDPFIGTVQAGRARPIKQLLFSKSSMLDRAEACMRGLGQPFEINPDGDMLHEFKQQLTAYERVDKEKSNGVIETEWIQKRPDDHYGSIHRMALAAAISMGLMDVPDALAKS